MSVLTSKDVLRPRAKGVKGWVGRMIFDMTPFLFSVMRRIKPVLTVSGFTLTSRYDHVREVFATDSKFGVIYGPKLDIIMGGEPFFLGLGDTPRYRRDTEAMRKVTLSADLPRLAKDVEARAEAIIAAASGQIEIVDELTRQVSFDFLAEYFGIPHPAKGDLRVWATRLFEFQFADSGNDKKLRAEVNEIAPALRAHIDAAIAQRHQCAAKDDVLGRCLVRQAAGEPGYSDIEIRTALIGFIVGGPPQPAMLLPQAMEQLLRRPKVLAEAQSAARSNDDEKLRRYVFEAMRFDPLAPGLPRVALEDVILARGTWHETSIKAGAQVLAAFASAMMDPRRVANPTTFDPNRPASDYMHFGFGLHECFGRHINRATLHMMPKPILKRENIRRAPGPNGRLRKNGPFAERLVVEFD